MTTGEITFTHNNIKFSLYLHPHLEWHDAPRYCLHNLTTDTLISEGIFTVSNLFSALSA